MRGEGFQQRRRMNALLVFGDGSVRLWNTLNRFRRRIHRPDEASLDSRLAIASERDHRSRDRERLGGSDGLAAV